MVSKTMVSVFSDLSGDADAAPLKFAVENTTYEIDLTHGEREEFVRAIAKYTEAGRKTSSGSRRTPARSASGRRTDLDDIRAWARANGHTVADRGRIAASVVSLYDAAN